MRTAAGATVRTAVRGSAKGDATGELLALPEVWWWSCGMLVRVTELEPGRYA